MRFARLHGGRMDDVIMIDCDLEKFAGEYPRGDKKNPELVRDLFNACPRVSSIHIPHSGPNSEIGFVTFKRQCPCDYDFIPYAIAHIGSYFRVKGFLRETPNMLDLYKRAS